MDDNKFEAELVAKGLTAPRITPADIKAAIASEHYFTAGDALNTECQCYESDKYPAALDLLTFCVLVLQNGFTVVGKSAVASPKNFDVEKGREVARADAISQMWPLLGYVLKERLHRQACEYALLHGEVKAPEVPAMPPHQQRVLDEKAELDVKVTALDHFIHRGAIFCDLKETERTHLKAQLVAMRAYADILGERIAAFEPVAK